MIVHGVFVLGDLEILERFAGVQFETSIYKFIAFGFKSCYRYLRYSGIFDTQVTPPT